MIKLLRYQRARLDASRSARLRCFCAKTQQTLFDSKVDEFKSELPDRILERLDRIAASAKLSQGERVLDVGAGTSHVRVSQTHRSTYEPQWQCAFRGFG